MTPISIAMPAPIPADVLGTLVPAALLAVWCVLVIAVIVALCAAVGVDDARVRRRPRPITRVADATAGRRDTGRERRRAAA